MKIQVEKGQDKPFLDDGRHTVEITQIDEGTSEYKGTPFFSCRFENEDGFVNQRFYTTGVGMAILMDLCRAAGIEVAEGQELDTNDLLHKKVSIEVGDYTYNDPENGSERTIKQASNFEPAQ